ncbi:hypothetical protein [Treponema sp.]|uniref:hypothetical protein n=1 Tax=Treponema sp. TaxID=166 RepID=UPI00389028CF
MKNIYNIIAQLCSLVINSCTEDFFVRYSCISKNEKTRISGIICEKLPVLFEKDTSKVHKISDSDLNESFFDVLDSLIESMKGENDFFCDYVSYPAFRRKP